MQMVHSRISLIYKKGLLADAKNCSHGGVHFLVCHPCTPHTVTNQTPIQCIRVSPCGGEYA